MANVDLVNLSGHAQAKIQLDVRNAAAKGIEIEHLHMAGLVDNPTTHPNVALQFGADGIATNGMTGSAELQADGPQEALVLKLSSDMHKAGEAAVRITSTATLNVPAKQVALSALQAQYGE